MFSRLKYKVTLLFPAKTLEAELFFEPGLTAITGPNGHGKSMILEMIQYGLFGSTALRGKADDYVELAVDLDFTLNGVQYNVERTPKRVVLSCENGPMASGTKPVNAAILNLFGYSYDVFKVANVANQGKIQEIGSMKPTERRRLIDETVGLTALDGLTEYIQTQIKSTEGGIKALESVLKEPEVPVKPQDYMDSETLQTAINTLTTSIKERDRVSALANAPLVVPDLVELEADDDKLDAYVAEREQHKNLESQISALSAQHKRIPEPNQQYLDTKLHERDPELAQLQEDQHQKDVLRFQVNQQIPSELNRLFAPEVTEAELVEEARLQVLESRKAKKRTLLNALVEHNCPKCNHQWHDPDQRLKDYEDVDETLPCEAKGWTAAYMEEERRRLSTNARRIELIEKLEEATRAFAGFEENKDLIAEIQRHRTMVSESQVAKANKEQRDTLFGHIQTLVQEREKLVDRTSHIQRISDKRTAHVIYQTKLERYEADKKAAEEAKVVLAGFPPTLDNDRHLMIQAHAQSRQYEFETKAYDKAKVEYDEMFQQLTGWKDDLANWQAGKEAIASLRAKVKGFLLPSLNSVASHLLCEMTGGELNWIQMNDQFEITVAGQRLETLSGAGEAVANLALRIGLGQVLTNRVFSSLMLDEADAGMDASRAAYTASCLKKLTGTIKQVILVTHKAETEADHYVRL